MRGKARRNDMPNHLLDVQGLETQFITPDGTIHAVNGVSFTMDENETIGLVGESGCGKSVTMLSVLRLLPSPPAKIAAGSALFLGRDLLKMNNDEMRKIRGAQISMVFQDPMTSFNPVLTIGRQLTEPLETHLGMSSAEARDRAAELLDQVGIPQAKLRLADYPHQFSGGMRQRAMIAMALACDLGVVANLCDSIRVMYAGKIVEEGRTRDIFYEPRHPYTWGLLNSIPKINIEEKERLVPIDGQPPDLLKPPAGCAFAERCPHVMAICQQHQPPLIKAGQGHEHRAACWLSHAQAAAVAAPLFAAQTQLDKLEGQA